MIKVVFTAKYNTITRYSLLRLNSLMPGKIEITLSESRKSKYNSSFIYQVIDKYTLNYQELNSKEIIKFLLIPGQQFKEGIGKDKILYFKTTDKNEFRENILTSLVNLSNYRI